MCPIKNILEDYRNERCSLEQAHFLMHKVIEVVAKIEKAEQKEEQKSAPNLPPGMPRELAEMLRAIGFPVEMFPGMSDAAQEKPSIFSCSVDQDDHKLHVTGPVEFEIDLQPMTGEVIRLTKYVVKCLNKSWDPAKAEALLRKSEKSKKFND